MAAGDVEDKESSLPPFQAECLQTDTPQKIGNDRNTPIREASNQDWKKDVVYPISPLGATPRSHLPQNYGIVQDPRQSKVKSRKRDSGDYDFEKSLCKRSRLSKEAIYGNAESLFTHIKERFKFSNVWAYFFLFMGLFLMSLMCLIAVYYNLPKLQINEARHVKIPRSTNEARILGKVLLRYKDRHFYPVLGGIVLTYIFLQSFAIPGTVFLSLLSGFLFPFFLALFINCLCSSLGATFCYLLSFLIGRSIVYRFFTSHISVWTKKVKQHQDCLIKYVIFLRLTPFVSNCVINILSSFIGLPLYAVFIGTLLGVALPSCLTILCGAMLYHLTTPHNAPLWLTAMQLTSVVILSFLPFIFRKKLNDKLD